MILTNKNWSAYATELAAPADPKEYSPSAIKNFVEEFDDYIVKIKGVRPQFRAHNSVLMMQFSTVEQREEYDKAWERYLAEKAKIESKFGGESSGNSRFMILVQFLKFRQAAELIRCEDLAQAMYDSVMHHKEAAVAALCFKASIAKCVKILHDKFGVPRSQISLIWGGGDTKVVGKRKKKLDLKHRIEESEAMKEFLEAEGLTMEDLELDNVEDTIKVEIDESLGLGKQSKRQRQIEIDNFQKGDSLYCFYTFKSGGVGLSLHHSDELTTKWDTSVENAEQLIADIQAWNKKQPANRQCKPGKCRRKPSGYVFEEDIPLIPTRQRRTFLSVVYSAIELVQGLGRAPRLTSLSDTVQTMMCYAGTIEERVARTVSVKLKCLREVVRQKESWEDVIIDHNKNAPVTEDIKELPPETDEDADQTIGLDVDGEEEEE